MTGKTEVTTARLNDVLERWRHFRKYEELLEAVQAEGNGPVSISGLRGSADAVTLHALARDTERPILAITGRSVEANDLYEDLYFLRDGRGVGHFPARQILPYDFRAPVGEIMGKRISTLNGLLNGSVSIVVCPVRALLEPTITVENLKSSQVSLAPGDEIELDELARRLINLGFRQVPLVEEVGDFARRGGLMDLFTPGSDAPVRVEFFGNDVDTIRQFDVATQRTTGRLDRVEVLPKREIPITQESLESYLDTFPEKDAQYIRVRYLNDPELPGLEWLSVMFGVGQGSLLDYLKPSNIVFFNGQGSVRSEGEAILQQAESLRKKMEGRLSRLPKPEEYFQSPDDVFSRLGEMTVVDSLPFRGGRQHVISFDCQPHPALASRLDLLAELVSEYDALGFTYVIGVDTRGQADRLRDLIIEKTNLRTHTAVEMANLHGGFVCQQAGLAVLTDHEIFSRHHRRVRKKKYKEGVAIADYTSLNRGDFVVHTDHGIARYLGLETIKVDNRNRDCLLLEYAEKDRLYVPIEEFNRVSKYAGKDGAPQLTHLGGPGWDRLKQKTKKAITKMAEDLIQLYAQRKASQGHSFGPDSVWLKQLEASFPFDETKDQEKAIAEVKQDMADERSMDRLICGDVGYGKTEVAVRAAFKAVDGGKQVAVLVPTTILAQQHFATFTERMADFPVKIGTLSRFRTKKQQTQTLEELAQGKVDLVIGTHRLLSSDVIFKDIGLLIIDEEHRFGVRHKEKLRRLKASVDTLAMTATPIPRTLQMSLVGVRDMSLIATSPKDRLPIITEIVDFDPSIIATAILREVDRGGQVFFVHNRVQTIDAMYQYLKKIVPQVEIGVAHGQMHERSLEGIMLAFLSGRFDVLLCTSIIESGLDIPNANTILLNRADRFGLAQLYQMRGRVGRSSRRAYAYLITPSIRLLGADAVKRLRALEAHSDLGSGFALAMRDLEIRGAGTMLGAKQSGFIEEIGFDLYNKLLEQAIIELKTGEVVEPIETRLEMDIEIYLSDTYVNDNQHKVQIYRRLADSRTLEEVDQIREEVTDRFGKAPQSATNLYDAAAVKIAASLLEIEKVKIRGARVSLFFTEEHQLTRAEVEGFRKATDCPMEFSLIGHPRIDIDLGSLPVEQRLSVLRGILSKI